MKRVFEGSFDEQMQIIASGTYDLYFEAGSKGTLYLLVQGEEIDCDVKMHGAAGCEVRIWFDLRAQRSIRLASFAEAQKDAVLTLSYLDVDDSDASYDLQAKAAGEGAQIAVHTATLCGCRKNWNMEIIHERPHTVGTMENYCIVKADAACIIKAVGNIPKGSYGSESHQKSRVLTMSDRHSSEVVPILYIDENDVKASHAMTLGQPDADQLYYLQTRGLNLEQALGLMSIGYFLPVIEQIANKDLREQIQCRVEEKVGLYGHQ